MTLDFLFLILKNKEMLFIIVTKEGDIYGIYKKK